MTTPPLQRMFGVSVVAGKELCRSLIINRSLELCSILVELLQNLTYMPRSRQSTAKEQRIVLNMLEADQDIPDITFAVGRSRGNVYNLRNNPTKLCAPACSGGPLTGSHSSFRRMTRKTRLGLATAHLVKAASHCPLLEGRVRYCMNKDENLAYRRMRRASAMTQVHRYRRVQ